MNKNNPYIAFFAAKMVRNRPQGSYVHPLLIV
jgi:hypothetical protein